jgi:beta-galactosidase
MSTRREFLAGLAMSPLLASQVVSALDDSLSIHSKPVFSWPLLGAEFFLNQTETQETVFHHFRLMRETGLEMARIFTIWDWVEPRKGQWDFGRFDWVYDAAAQNEMRIANTLCAEDPASWLGLTPSYHAKEDLSNPLIRPYAEIYLEKVVDHYKRHPAHGVWLLQNEPNIRPVDKTPQPWLLAQYAQWLQKKYGVVDALNRSWYRKLPRFQDAQPPEFGVNGWSDFAENLDWQRFNDDHLVEQVRWLSAQVARHDPGSITHVQGPNWRYKPVVDSLGGSIHASHDFDDLGITKLQDFGVAFSYEADTIRSFAIPGPWWVTEMQAGAQILFTGSRHFCPTGSEITRWLWDGFGNGAQAVLFWLWNPRTEGFEAGEWGIALPDGGPTDRTRAAQAVARALRKHESFFAAAKPLPARVAILYDYEARLLFPLDHGYSSKFAVHGENEVDASRVGCYEALRRAHVTVDLLPTDYLEMGGASHYRVLYLPNCYALTEKSVAALRDFVRQGGTLWADGLVAWKDEQGTTLQFPPGPLADVFGFTLDGIDPVWEPFALAGDGDRAGESWRCLITSQGARTLLTGSAGRPAAVEYTFGKGRSLYYGTALSLGYLHREDPQAGDWITAPALDACRDLPVRLTNGSELISFRAMQAPGQFAAILNNWGASSRATVRFPGTVHKVVEILSGNNAPFRRVGGVLEVDLELDEGGSAVMLATAG